MTAGRRNTAECEKPLVALQMRTIWDTRKPLNITKKCHACHAKFRGVDIHLHLAWQAWHLVTSTVVSRGRRGTYGTGLALVARLGRLGRRWRRGTLRGRRGTWWHPPSSCMAGVALGDIHRHLAWQAWHLATSTFVSRGRRGAYGVGRLWWRAWAGLVAGDFHASKVKSSEAQFSQMFCWTTGRWVCCATKQGKLSMRVNFQLQHRNPGTVSMEIRDLSKIG